MLITLATRIARWDVWCVAKIKEDNCEDEATILRKIECLGVSFNYVIV